MTLVSAPDPDDGDALERVVDPDGGGGEPPAAAVEDPSRRDELGEFIREQREAAKLSLRNLSKLAGVSNPYLSQIERGLRNPSAEILQAIAKALEISSETLYVRAGILEERPDGGGVESAIARDPLLTEAQRASLLENYRTYLRLNTFDEQDNRGRGRGSVVGRVLGSLQTGDVDDVAMRRATAPEEDPDEA